MSKSKRHKANRKSSPDSAVPGSLPLRRTVLFAGITLLVAIGVPEAMVRIFWEPPIVEPFVGERQFVQWLSRLSVDPRSSQQFYCEDRKRLWALIPGATIDSFNPHYDPRGGERQAIRISINTDGYRGPRYKPRREPGTLRVLCLGDSNLFGYPLDDAATFPSALSRALRRESAPTQHVEVVNGGIPGYTVLQGRIWYEQQFKDFEYDWLVLSYLNNDAWPQPQPDSRLLAHRQALPGWLTSLGDEFQLVKWGQSWRNRQIGAQPLVPRVGLEEFLLEYRALIQSAKSKGAKVLLLDFRAYEPYKPYSTALERLAKESEAQYVMVMEECSNALRHFENLQQYESERLKAQRRWGKTLKTHPHLWMYAEMYPEHLNEAGTVWLADRVCTILTAQQGKPRDVVN